MGPLYSLNNKDKNYIKIFVQNGYRAVAGHVFDNLMDSPPAALYSVDYMCVLS